MQPLPDHNDRARSFAAGLLDPNAKKPAEIVGPRGKRADKRYNVYRNNVTVSLVESLGDIFPAVSRLTGEGFFEAMAREFVRAHPPTSPLLFEYGHGFAEFIDGFKPARSVPYLADVARLERAWLTAYHAADIAALDPAELAAVPAEAVAAVRFAMHPAFAVVRSRFPLHSIFMMNRDFAPLEPVDMRVAEPAVVTRPGADVHVTRLTPAEAVFFRRIATGTTLGEAAAAGLEADASFDLNRALTVLLQTGACTRLHTEPEIEREKTDG